MKSVIVADIPDLLGNNDFQVQFEVPHDMPL